MQLIVGREGNQPFVITNAGVGRQHLQVTIPASMDGDWIVKDLNSTNGTFVQEEDGSFRQLLGEERLRWDSVVRMGPANVMGYTFWLCQLLQTDPKDFSYQFRKLHKMLDDCADEKVRIEEETKNQRQRMIYLRVGLTLAVVIIAAVVFEDMIIKMIGMTVAGALVQLIDLKKEKPKMSRDYKLFMRCPNGACGKPLSEHDIRNGLCPYCKAHI
ncbi:MAG: FHA domain-containing protein [Paludibacteraceae bacterium]|nr:FHA domain-containing protein [Paludibacteraceae bacterium]MBR6117025.1 FHA domain-containing protein [Paludibacteraceae bacterium]